MHWVASPESSTITRFGYHPENRYLDVEFTGGRKYRYFDVPESTFVEMIAAASKGQFLTYQIKGRYPYARL